MSDKILKALMQLFAIVARVSRNDESENLATDLSNLVKQFLATEVNHKFVDVYYTIHADYLNKYTIQDYDSISGKKKTAVNSVKILRICNQLNNELSQKQKIIVIIKLFEFVKIYPKITFQELDFLKTVADSFHIDEFTFDLIKHFVLKEDFSIVESRSFLYFASEKKQLQLSSINLLENLDAPISFLHIQNKHLVFVSYSGKDELLINGQIVGNNKVYLFNPGSSIRTAKTKSIYYSDVISQFNENTEVPKINYSVENISLVSRKKIHKIHPFNLQEENGKLVGIMGGSGTGKTTLLNILNGNIKPSSGKVTLNGIDLHIEKEALIGVIGYVSQEDLLIEELTVFQNLYFNAELFFENTPKIALRKKVIETLRSVGLIDIMDRKVGSPFDKSISGGQRKRLNIAMELIRQPQLLFLDEPTSGLSSRDSENIIDLLKELSLNGKLVFCVIHQPSSDIYKLFDRMIILDEGGYPIFDGYPMDAISHFKQQINHIHADETECQLCGNVNPEQIFNIIDAKLLDEYGNLTNERKVSPAEWNQVYLAYQDGHAKKIEGKNLSKLSPQHYTNKLNQFRIFFLRDALSKLNNFQFLIYNISIAPILAIVLALFVRYHDKHDIYTYFGNENIPQYFFIGIIVSLFLGLTIAADEINKDKRILIRENFLRLSRGSYLLSKTALLFIISAIQTGLFVLISNSILQIPDFYFSNWLMLFSLACLANITGLNISSGLNSSKLIYITIPLLIIPQILLSGVFVKFNRLNPSITTSVEVPFIGDIMATRWAYEGIVTKQIRENEFEAHFFQLEKEKNDATWKKDYWIPEIKNQLHYIISNDKKQNKTLLYNELAKECSIWKNIPNAFVLDVIKNNSIDSVSKSKIEGLIDLLDRQYTINYNTAQHKIDSKIKHLGNKTFIALQKRYYNKNLYDLVTNRHELHKLEIVGDEIRQNYNTIYMDHESFPFYRAPYYVSEKEIGFINLSSFSFNIIVIWLMSIIGYILLYFNVLKVCFAKMYRFSMKLFRRRKF